MIYYLSFTTGEIRRIRLQRPGRRRRRDADATAIRR